MDAAQTEPGGEQDGDMMPSDAADALQDTHTQAMTETQAEENDGENNDGEVNDGEVNDGEEKDGVEKDREEKDGEEKDGEEKDREEKDGEAKDGEVKDGEDKNEEEKAGEENTGEEKEGSSQMSVTVEAAEESEKEPHKVIVTVTIAVAYKSDALAPRPGSELDDDTGATNTNNANKDDAGSDDSSPSSRKQQQKKKRVLEAPKPQNHFHFEYLLVPEGEDRVRSDVVTYGIAAKVYTEKLEPKVLKTWNDGELVWVAWTHCHALTVTDELLLQMFNHRLELRVWDTKDKLSNRARFDRPRAFKLPQAKPGQDDDSVGGVKALVMKQSRSFELLQPKSSFDRPLPGSAKNLASVEEAEAGAGTVAGEGARDEASGDKLTEDTEASAQRDKLPSIPAKRQAPHHALNVEKMNTYTRISKLAGRFSATTPAEQPPHQSTHRQSVQRQSAPPQSAQRQSAQRQSSQRQSVQRQSVQRQSVNRSSTADPFKLAPLPRICCGDSILENSSLQGNKPPPEKSLPLATRARKNSRRRQSRYKSVDGGGGKKKEKAQALSLAEEIRKNGIVCLSIPLARLFSGLSTITERLKKPVGSVMDLFLSVGVNGALMTEEQHRRLNPLVIHVHSATQMPTTPYSFHTLRERCEPVYVKYKFHSMEETRSSGRAADQNIYWDHVNVILAGILDPWELMEFLQGPGLAIEVHDRDRKPTPPTKLDATLFGDDLEDEKINNVCTVAGRRTTHNAFGEKERAWDPYGVAQFDLSGLLMGQKVLHMKAAILPCGRPDMLGGDLKATSVPGVPAAVDGPVEGPLKQGHYVDSEAMLKIRVSLAYPLPVRDDSSQHCPFGRIVFRFAYHNTELLQLLEALVLDMNARALGLHDMPTHVRHTALSTYKLSVEQQENRQLDIVTGFHVLDGEMHLFVLEGIKEQAINHIWTNVPKPYDSDVEVLYHSGMAFGRRLYGPLDVDVCRIKLHEPLRVIVQQPLLYVRDMLPKPCFLALTKLTMLCSVRRLRDAVRADLFPAADMIVSMSREFGVPLTAQDFEELCVRGQHEEAAVAAGGQEAGRELMPQPSRMWTPIDNHNDKFLQNLHNRQSKDFRQTNMDSVHEQSTQNAVGRPRKRSVRVDLSPAHNYSSQRLNSTSLASDALRHMLSEQGGEHLYSYCQDYHHRTLEPAGACVEESRWRTVGGWSFPGKKTMIQSNQHPKKPHTARIDELAEEWQENALFAGHQVAPVSGREHYPWPLRKRDLDTWTRPAPQPPPCHVGGAGGESEQEEVRARRQQEEELWRSKVVVENVRPRMHRVLAATELCERGRKAASQLHRLQGLRKDPPHSTGCGGFHDTQPYAVLHNMPHHGEHNKYKPGAYDHYSWALARNHIPIHDSTLPSFKHGMERSAQYRRPVPPLTHKQANMFRWPTDDRFTLQFQRSYTIPNINDMQQLSRQESGGENAVAVEDKEARMPPAPRQEATLAL